MSMKMPLTWNDSCPSNFQKGKQHLLQFWFTNVRYLFDEEIKIIYIKRIWFRWSHILTHVPSYILHLLNVLYRYFRKSYYTEFWFPALINACIHEMTTSETIWLRSNDVILNVKILKNLNQSARNNHCPIFIHRSSRSYIIV